MGIGLTLGLLSSLLVASIAYKLDPSFLQQPVDCENGQKVPFVLRIPIEPPKLFPLTEEQARLELNDDLKLRTDDELQLQRSLQDKQWRTEMEKFEPKQLQNQQAHQHQFMLKMKSPQTQQEERLNSNWDKFDFQNHYVAPITYNMPKNHRVSRAAKQRTMSSKDKTILPKTSATKDDHVKSTHTKPIKPLKTSQLKPPHVKTTEVRSKDKVSPGRREKRSLVFSAIRAIPEGPTCQRQPEVIQFMPEVNAEVNSLRIHQQRNSCPICASLPQPQMCPSCMAGRQHLGRSPFLHMTYNGQQLATDHLGHMFKVEDNGRMKLITPDQMQPQRQARQMDENDEFYNNNTDDKELIRESLQNNPDFRKASHPSKKGELAADIIEQQVDFFRYLHELNKQLNPKY